MTRLWKVLFVVLLAAPCWAVASAQEFSAPLLDSSRAVLEAYEEVRVELAADRLEGVPESASQLVGALQSALDAAEPSGRVAVLLEGAIVATESLARAEDLELARIEFGEVSRHMLRLGEMDARLTEDRYVFTCPMAKGFERWIQPMEEMKNPYMGPVMLQCGSAVDWSVPVVQAADGTTRASGFQPPEVQPELAPGIPDLVMEDVRDHKFLWREIEELQTWERTQRITVAEFRSKTIEKTVHFLDLRGAEADEFTTAATEAVSRVWEAFKTKYPTVDWMREESESSENPFTSELEQAVAHVTSRLGDAPRHRLFQPTTTKWLLKLAFGPREAKEAGKAEQAR